MGLVSPELLNRSRYAFRHEITTRFADVDPNQHINNVALFAAFEDARAVRCLERTSRCDGRDADHDRRQRYR